jgi:hypothetical protein
MLQIVAAERQGCRELKELLSSAAVTFLRVRVSARDVACVQTVKGLLVEGVRGCLPATSVLRARCFDY